MLLIATCMLAGQTLFAVPDGWTITKAYSGGIRDLSGSGTMVFPLYCSPDCEATRQKAYVELTHGVRLGETVVPPNGCSLELKAPGEPELTASRELSILWGTVGLNGRQIGFREDGIVVFRATEGPTLGGPTQ